MAKNKRGNKKGLAVACLLASICGKTGAMEKPVNNKVAVQRTNPEKSSNLKKVLIVGGTIFGLGAFGAGIYGLTKLFGDKEELDNGNQKPVEDPIKKEYFDILRSFYEPNIIIITTSWISRNFIRLHDQSALKILISF